MYTVLVAIVIIFVILLILLGYFYTKDRDMCDDGKLTVPIDTYSFYDCVKHKKIKCKYGIFLRDDGLHECINDICKNNIILYETIGDYRIPTKMKICLPNTNDPIEKSCEISTETILDDNFLSLLNSNFPVPVIPRFPETRVPFTQLSTNTGECVEFEPNLVRMVTHNPLLPLIPLNIRTKQIEYSPNYVGGEEFFFTDYNKIRGYPSNEIVEGKYANFTALTSIQHLEYQDSVRIIRGDSDGVTYLISFQMPPFRQRNTRNFCGSNVEDISGQTCGGSLWWSTYAMQYVSPIFAQSFHAKTFLAMIEFNDRTFTFAYKIEARPGNLYSLHVLTLFGFCSFSVELNKGVEIDANGYIANIHLPMYDNMLRGLGCTCSNNEVSLACQSGCYNTTVVVTNIYNGRYNYKHIPIFLPHIKIIEMQFPSISLGDYGLTVDDLFSVPHEYIYKSPLPESMLSSCGNI
jgi:hypothetical protein